MVNVMRTAEEFLDAKLIDFASEEVLYCPYDVAIPRNVKAVIGKSFFRSDDVNGVSVYTRSIDFIIPVCELANEPAKGDVIVRNGQSYEVFAPNNEPCWRYSGGNHETYRIHTHSIGDEVK